MGLNSGDRIIHHGPHAFHHFFGVLVLKTNILKWIKNLLWFHFFGNLADTVTNTVSNFWVGVFMIAQYEIHDRSHFFNVVNIFAHLRECHDSCVFVTPILLREKFLNELRETRQHYFFAHRRDQTVDALYSELDGFVAYIFSVVVETFRRTFPGLRYLSIDFHLI